MDKKLIIPINEIESFAEMVYVGDHVRPSSITSIVLLSPDTLACCHFDGCKIMLIRFDLDHGTYNLLQCSDTTFNQKKCRTDLMATDRQGNLVVSNGHEQSCTLYRYENEQIRHVRDLHSTIGNFAHGVKFYTPDIVAVTSRWDRGGTFFIDCKTGNIVYYLRTPGVSVQDICFLPGNRAAMLYTLGSPTYGPRTIYPSILQLIDFEIGRESSPILKEINFKDSHIDSIVSYENRLYFTDQYNNRVIVCNAENLDILDEIGGYDFPHGIDVNYDILAVTNYGSNSVELRTLGG
ncbi:MAG: YncE family protein [Burkholderiales bacterium]